LTDIGKIAVVGAGAIGGVIALRLAKAGHQVSLLVRGENLRVIQAHGLRVTSRLKSASGEWREIEDCVRMKAVSDPAELGPQDAVFIATKGHSIPDLLPTLKPMINAQTIVVPAINGLPWWYFYRIGGPNEGRVLHSVDPLGTMFEQLDCKHIVGCVVYIASELVAPGRVNHTHANSLIFGEPSGEKSARSEQLANWWQGAGMEARVSSDIRNDIWVKLTGNLAFNTVSAITGCNISEIVHDPLLIDCVRSLLEECLSVAHSTGVKPDITVERRIEMAGKIGGVRPSTLQDFEAGRRPELEGLLGCVIELAGLAGVAVPTMRNIYALAMAKARHEGLLA
jgi:2-dehydropantoate 2-reductase